MQVVVSGLRWNVIEKFWTSFPKLFFQNVDIFMWSLLCQMSVTFPFITPKTTKDKNYLHKQPEWGLSEVEAVHRVILPFTPKRLWSQWGWHARTGACQGEYTASGTAQQPPSRSIQHTLQRNVILYGPFNTLQIHSPSITTAQTHNKAARANIGRPFLPGCPSFYLSDCLPVLWWEETNLCLHFELTRLPVPHSAGQRQPQSRPSKSNWGALAIWYLESGHPAESCQAGNSD